MRIAIIGAGIIGLTSAYHLLKDGHEVTLVDAAAPGTGASHGNAGWIVPAEAGPVPAPGMVLKGLTWMLHKDSPLYIKPSPQPDFVRFMVALARRCNAADFDQALRANLSLCEGTMAMLDRYAADGVEFEMHTTGLIAAYADRRNFEHRVADLAAAREYGLEPEILTGKALHEFEPALLPTLAGGVYFPHERSLRPDSFIQGLALRCQELGATFVNHTPVTRVVKDTRVRALETSAGEVEADAFLLATGAHSGPLVEKFGTRLPVRPGKGYSIDYTPVPVKLHHAVNLSDAKVAVTPLDGTLRLAGTMEFAGLDKKVNAVRVAAIKRAPVRYFEGWDPTSSAHTAPWAGARPMTPDGLPIIGRLPGLDNTWVATGHGMLGVTLAPATGRGIARAIATGEMPSEFAPFTPERYFSAGGRPVAVPRQTASAARSAGRSGDLWRQGA